MDPKLQRVIDAGTAAGIDVEPRTFTSETRTAEDAARNVGCDVAQIVKSLVFISDRGPLVFLVSGANRLDTEKGARAAGVARLERLDATAAKAATGYSIGATPPLGLPGHLEVFMDEDLLQHEVVWAAAGRPDSVFPADPRELRRAADATAADLKID
ncbi:MAG: YbaK/EbsC family protein [Actinobacteria bacterium]|nr:YbaK/EbsC family protein [Actinomycetota bacterium]